MARIAWVVAAAGLATAAGIGTGLLSIELALLSAVAALGLVLLAVARAALAPARVGISRYAPVRDTRAATSDEMDRTAAEAHLRFPRLLYYLGASTLGLLTVRPALSFTLSDWFFLASLAVTCVVLITLRRESEYLVPAAVTFGALLFGLGGLASSPNADEPFESIAVVARLLYLTLVWFWLGTMVLRTRAHVKIALIAWIVSAAISGAAAVAQYFAGDVIPGGIIEWGRMSGFTPHFNNLGGLSAVALVPALMIAAESRGVIRSVGAFGMVGCITSGLLLSGSVGGLLAATIATILWAVVLGPSRRIVALALVLSAATLVLMSTKGTTDSPSPVQRFLSVTAQDVPADRGGSVQSRIEVFGDAWSQIEKQPLVGVGLDDATSERVLGQYRVHNVVLNPWFTAGLLGVAGLLMIIGGVLHIGRLAVRGAESSADRSLMISLFAALVAFIVFAMGEPILFVRYGWVPAALLLALRAQTLRSSLKSDRQSPIGAGLGVPSSQLSG